MSGPKTSTTHPSNVAIPVVDNDIAEDVSLDNNGPVSDLKTELTSEGGEVSPLQVMLGGG